jgi:hypothetical protein
VVATGEMEVKPGKRVARYPYFEILLCLSALSVE